MNDVQGGINADMEAIGPRNFVVTRIDRTMITVVRGLARAGGDQRASDGA